MASGFVLGWIELMIVAVVSLIFLFVLGCMVLIAWRVLRGQSFRRSRQAQAEEARLIQEIHQGLSKMDRRVEALETILLERARPECAKNTEI